MTRVKCKMRPYETHKNTVESPSFLGPLIPSYYVPRPTCSPPRSSAPCPARTAAKQKTGQTSGRNDLTVSQLTRSTHFVHVAGPLHQVLEGGLARDVVDEDDALDGKPRRSVRERPLRWPGKAARAWHHLCAPVVLLGYGLIAFLTRRVPAHTHTHTSAKGDYTACWSGLFCACRRIGRNLPYLHPHPGFI